MQAFDEEAHKQGYVSKNTERSELLESNNLQWGVDSPSTCAILHYKLTTYENPRNRQQQQNSQGTETEHFNRHHLLALQCEWYQYLLKRIKAMPWSLLIHGWPWSHESNSRGAYQQNQVSCQWRGNILRQLWKETAAHEKRCSKNNLFAAERLNGTSDLAWEDYNRWAKHLWSSPKHSVLRLHEAWIVR